ncbi:MAG: heme-binding protein [Candidatus Korobacteraceae bacterium]|jgi:uncharacterized protein GlcG (DUF336 family)
MNTDSLPFKRVLTLEAARAISDFALAEAVKRGFNQLVIVVVDDGGYLLTLQRQDDAEVAAIDIGIAKARTAAIFKRNTKEWKERLLEGKYWVLGMPNMAPIEGGIPIVADGRVIGAVGIAGAQGGQDSEIGLASLAVLQDGKP